MKVSIRTKLVFYTVIITGLASGGIAYYAYDQQQKGVYKQLEERGKALGDSLSRTLTDPIYTLQIDELLYLLRSVRHDPDITATYALDGEGVILSDGTKRNLHRGEKLENRYVQEALASQTSIIERVPDAYVIVKPVRLPNGRTIGYAYIEISLVERKQQFNQILQRTMGLSVLFLVFASVLAYVLAYFISVPIAKLVEASQVVEKGNFEIHIHSKRQDELGTLTRAFNTMISGLRERVRERDIFGRLVSPQVREKLLQGKLELGGETRSVSILFSDIRGFSTTSESLDAQQVLAFLNEYLAEMTRAVRQWGGYLNSFIGDAVLAVFGAPMDQPDKEWRAVATAITMRERLADLNHRREKRGDLPIEIGIGICTGDVVVGLVGSLERLQYTVIGDAVNVAERLQELSREQPSYPVLVNGLTARALTERSDLLLKNLGPVQVRGRTQPVDVYAVIGWHNRQAA